MPPTVRDARADDCRHLVEFNARMAEETEHLKLDNAVLTAGVRNGLADPAKARYFVAELDGAVAGSLMITHEWSDWRNGDIWWIQSVYVRPEFRRRGVFRALYAHVRALATKSGVVGLRLYVETQNKNAQQTYSDLGMTTAHYLVMEEMPLK
jgi:GNAT superfamily N-acetyltransferase